MGLTSKGLTGNGDVCLLGLYHHVGNIEITFKPLNTLIFCEMEFLWCDWFNSKYNLDRNGIGFSEFICSDRMLVSFIYLIKLKSNRS